MVAIPPFVPLAHASVTNFGGRDAGVIVVREDADSVAGIDQELESARVALTLLEGAGEAVRAVGAIRR